MSEFRWSQLASSQDGLFELSKRVVGRGEYKGLTFHEIEARSIISKAPPSTPWFGYSINAYRGCSHACTYCFARPTHEYLGFNMGDDFDSQIVVKTNAVDLVRAETEPSRWGGDMIAMGTNTDPYQAAEGKYKLTKGIIEVLAERGNDFSILTKSPLVLRDVDLIRGASRKAKVSVSFSVATLDEEVWRRTEPGVPHPRKRLDALARLRGAGISGGVMVAPLLPGISDRPEQVAAVKKAAADAGAEWVNEVRLHLRGVRPHFMNWLAADSPDLVQTYERLYPPRRRRTVFSTAKVSNEAGQLSLFSRLS
ncbi:MAG TPA: radical SAM protein [Acidimicrobiia bacterium]|nr:radical SAM protein [Acidimicrobiia bacterium]